MRGVWREGGARAHAGAFWADGGRFGCRLATRRNSVTHHLTTQLAWEYAYSCTAVHCCCSSIMYMYM